MVNIYILINKVQIVKNKYKKIMIKKIKYHIIWDQIYI
jgi:hypothetical protein